MSNQYVPTTDRVRDGYTEGIREIGSDEHFDRWLALVKTDAECNYVQRITDWLEREADKADTSTLRVLHLTAADLVRVAAVAISLEEPSNDE